MGEAALSPLAGWENFYVIVGSSAGALTGLQFVVIVLIAEAQTARSMREIRAFGTPNVVHFGSSLLISAILSVPWRSLSSAGVCLGICAIAGVVYAIRVIMHARGQTGYKPDMADWIWYIALPLVAYAVLAGAAILLPLRPAPSLFAVAGTALLLLFTGIHNAWDTVTYIAISRGRESEHRKDQR